MQKNLSKTEGKALAIDFVFQKLKKFSSWKTIHRAERSQSTQLSPNTGRGDPENSVS